MKADLTDEEFLKSFITFEDGEYRQKVERMRKLVIALVAKAQCAEKLAEALMDFGRHDYVCIRSMCSQGRPTPNGGYEQMFGNSWYESKPVDRTPKCTCGLDEALSAWDSLQPPRTGKEAT